MMLPHRALALIFCSALFAACDNDPHPPPLHEKRADGTPWRVRYAGIRDDARSLDPQFCYEQMGHSILETICDTPVEYDPMQTDPFGLQPCLLFRMPEKTVTADGGVTYSFQLKPNIFYQDDPCFPGGKGRELTSADMEYSIKRMCDPKVECPILSTLQEFVLGMGEAFDAAKKNGGVFDYSQPLSGVEVVDRYTFRIHLKQPYPQLLYWMAMQFFSPTPREAVEYYDGLEHPDGPGSKMVVRQLFRWHPVTTGPFRLESYKPGQALRFIRNENYRTTTFPTGGWAPEMEPLLRPLAGAQLPLVDEIQMPILREELPIWLLTRQGYLDGAGIGKDAFNSAVTASRQLSAKFAARGMKLGRKVEPSTFWLMFNMQDPVLGPNRKLRQALSCSYDAQGWIDIFYNGTADLATQLIPPGFYGHQKGLKNPYGFDLTKGKRLIAEAGYPNGIDPKTGQPLELAIDATASDSWTRQTVEFEQRCLEQLGVHVRVNENTFTRQQEKLDQGNFQIASSGWGADYPDPENYFFLFYSKNFPLSGQNWARYANPEFDRMFEKMATMENSPERLELVHQMTAFLIEDCPIVLNFHKAYLTILQPWAPRTNHNDMLEVGLKYVVADPVLRDQKRREWNRQPVWPIGLGVLGVAALAGYSVLWSRRKNV